ncbi:MAG TPA: hypothetical protein VGA51_19120 [Casimicrobiaceae bacterium]
MASPAFTPVGPFWVPLVGYPTAPGIDVSVVCMDNGERRSLVSGDSHEDWIQRLVVLPAGWCAGAIRVVARSESSTSYVGIGTPHSASTVDDWLRRAPAHAFHHFVAFAPLAVLFVALRLVADRLGAHLDQRTPMALIGVATVGYLAFFVASIGGRSFGLYAVFGSLVLALGLLSAKARIPRPTLQCLGSWYALSLALYLFLVAADIGVEQWDPAYRFRPAEWSSDHLLPAMVAEGIYRHKAVNSILGGGWNVADRPPLQAGLLLVLRPFWETVVPGYRAPSTLARLYTAAAIIIQSSALVLAYVFAQRAFRAASSRREFAIAALLVLSAPLFLFNTIYAWPKLLSAGLALAGASLILWLPADRGIGQRAWSCGLAGLLMGYALLAHASVAFGLLALPVLYYVATGRWRIPELAACAVVALLIWLPWSAWQAAAGQPGNALTKFALAGTFDFDFPTRSLRDAVAARYAGLTLSQWAATRMFALLTLAGFAMPQPAAFMTSRPSDALGALRISDFLFVFPALRLWLLAFVLAALLAIARRHRESADVVRTTVALALAGIAGILINALVTWSVHLQLTQSHLALLLLYCAAAGALLLLPPWIRYALIALQTAYVGVVWIVGPLLGRIPDPGSLIAGGAALGAAIAIALGALAQPSTGELRTPGQDA